MSEIMTKGQTHDLMLSLKGRTKWAIEYIIGEKHLSNVKLGKLMDIAPGTINSYRRKTTRPNPEFITQFCEKFNFNVSWFIQGVGYPFPDAKEQYPETLGPHSPSSFSTAHSAVSIPILQDNEETQEQLRDIKISSDLTLAAKVLESNTSYANALHLNILSFAKAISIEDDLVNYREELGTVKIKLSEMNVKVEQLQKELEEQRKPLPEAAVVITSKEITSSE